MTRQVLCAVMILTAGAAAAQDRDQASAQWETIELGPYAAQWGTIELGKAQAAGKLMAVEMKTTTGAPYSGEATTEFVQSLADGNRIVRKTVTRIFRDSDGRVRRETLAADGTTVESITIVDPVLRNSVTLNPETKTAYGETKKLTMVTGRGMATFGPRDAELNAAFADRQTELRKQVETLVAKLRDAKKESTRTNRQDLGQRTLEGVAARGTRTTTVIPAGEIGNEQPIQIISEEWYSPELQILMLTKHSDPRSGETTYTLANVTRAEPARSLFEIPGDYAFKPVPQR